MTKPRNDRSQAVTKFCLAMEEHRRSEAGRVRTAKEFVAQFFPHDDSKAKDLLFVHIPREVRGPVLSNWGIRGAKAAVRDDDEKIASVVHDALVAGDINEALFEEGVTAQIVVDWIALPDWWSFWRHGKLTGAAIQKALATARELGLIDDRWFLANVQGRGGKLKGTDVVCDTLSKDQIVAWVRKIHESGDGSPAGIVAAVGWEVVLAKTAQDALLFALDAFARKAGLVAEPEPKAEAGAKTSAGASLGPASLGSSSLASSNAGAATSTVANSASLASSTSGTPLVASSTKTSGVTSVGAASSAATLASTGASTGATASATTGGGSAAEPLTTRHEKLVDGHPTVNAPHNIIAAAEAEIIRAQVSKAERERRDSGAIPAVVAANVGPSVTVAGLTPAVPAVRLDEERPSIPTVNGERATWTGPEEESPKLAEARAAMMATLMHSSAPSEPWDSEVPAKPSSLEWPEPGQAQAAPVVHVPVVAPLPTSTSLGEAIPIDPPSDDFISIDTLEDEDVRSEHIPQPKAPTVPPPLPNRGSGPRVS